jgi:DNA-binding response OmpR family regulator
MNKRILLADDSLTIQKVVELTFMDESFDVVAVGSGDEAVASLGAELPDILIADVHMPGPSGYEVCRRAKETDPSLPVLLLVGTFETLDEEELVACGADGNLKKPFDSQELLQVVREMTRGPRGVVSAPPEDAPTAGFDLGATPEGMPALGVSGPLDADSGDSIALDTDGEADEIAATSDDELDLSALEEVSLEDEAAEISLESPEPDDEVELSAERTTDWELSSYVAPTPDIPSLASEMPESLEPEPVFAEAPPLDTSFPEPLSAGEAPPSAGEPPLAGEEEEPLMAGEEIVEEPNEDVGSLESAGAPPVAPTEPAPTTADVGLGVSGLSDEDVERVARRVVEILADDTIREVAWDVIPDMAEIVIKDRIRELEAETE